MKPLTERQKQIVRLVSDGLGDKQIAGQLGVCVQTVKNTLVVIYQKIGIRGRVLLTRYAIREGLIKP